jgi:hypothetical protein
MASKKSTTRSRKQKPSRTSIANYLQRSAPTRDELPRFLIVCEGTCTEPYYFEALAQELRLSVDIRVEGLGDNTDSLVERAIAISAEDNYTQVWCVFDRDSFPAGRFNRAINLAHRNGLFVAYSNEAFELWYVLHFEFLQTGLPRADYEKKLSLYLRKRYKKNSSTIYKEIHINQAIAIRNASTLFATYNPIEPERNNPSTTVHLLLIELFKYRRP